MGTTGYLAAQLFNQRAGTDLPIAPYPSTAQATTDLMTGRISIAFASAANVLQLIEDGKLTALAVAQPKRVADDADGALIDEAGLPGVHASLWIGLLAPAGTPRRSSMRCRAPSTRRFSPMMSPVSCGAGLESLGGTPEEFEQQIRSDTARWDAVLEATKPDK